MLPDETEEHGDVGSDEQDRSDESEQGKNPRHQARLAQQGAQQQGVHGRHEALSEEERPAIQDDQRLGDDQPSRSDSGLPQGHDRQEARDASEDGGGFQDSRADEAQRDPFVLPLDYREQRDGGADAGESHDDLQDTADDGGSVRARADDVVRTAHRTVEKEGRDRDKGEQVEHARDKCGLSKWTHLKLLLFDEVIDMMTTN